MKSKKKNKDFGMSRSIEGREEEGGGRYHQVVGKLIPTRWSAPEALGQRKSTTKSDVWMLGKTKTIQNNNQALIPFQITVLGDSKISICSFFKVNQKSNGNTYSVQFVFIIYRYIYT